MTPLTVKLASSSYPLRGLLIAQFFGAFNDNAWKLMVALLAIRQATAQMTPGPQVEITTQTEIAHIFLIFTLPLAMFSVVGGTLADRLSKRTVIIAIKSIEVFLMCAGTLALWQNPTGGILPLIVLCGMGIHSALFSPSKYGILPELISHEHLVSSNALLETWTFIAILTGTAAGGFLLQMAGSQLWMAPLSLAILSAIGLLAAFYIPHVVPARSSGGVVSTIQIAWSAIQSEQMLRLAIYGEVFFWTIASLFGQNVLAYAKVMLHLSDALAGLPLTLVSIGIAVGSILVGRLSQDRVEYGLIPLGATGVFISLFLLGALEPSLAATFSLMGLLGVSSAFIFVPLNAILQWKAPPDRRGATISFSNTCVFSGILLGSLASTGLVNAGLSTTEVFLATASATVGGTLWALWLLPEALLRLLLVISTHTFYRLRIVDSQHIPSTGGALFVPNHISFIDGLLLMTCIDRPLRFIVDTTYLTHPLLKLLMSTMKVIPSPTVDGVHLTNDALSRAGQALDAGEVVCLFPEGQYTKTGTFLSFQGRVEYLLKGRNVPIIPVYLDRIWGSIFSVTNHRIISKWPERIPYPVTVSFGAPQLSTTPTYELCRLVRELGEVAWNQRRIEQSFLHHPIIKSWRRRPFTFAMADKSRPHVSCLQALAGTIMLARALKPYWGKEQNMGLILPPSVAGALINIAVSLSGKTSINLNYTAGYTDRESAIAQTKLKIVLTSHQFIEQTRLDLPQSITILWLEDIVMGIHGGEKLIALLMAVFMPIRLLERTCGQSGRPAIDDPATIIFTSGSMSAPKCVPLSHFNINTNVEGAAQVIHISKADCALGILPFFHSFGYMLLWFYARHNTGIVFHPSPLDGETIGELCSRYRISLLVVTPTLLQLYQRRCTPEQLSALRLVLTGTEKLPLHLAQSFQDRFGLVPVEGYGVTECAPVISTNCPDFRASGFSGPVSRPGTVGQPLPGVSIRIVDPDSWAILSPGQPGMLLVKGPNLMNGYLGNKDLTTKVMRDGWYITGDIATLDEDGFLTITDRLARFSKIGGEMVSHGRVEEALQRAAGISQKVFAVIGIPDDKKGERLVVLYTVNESRIVEILHTVTAQGLSNLYTPSRNYFIKVNSFPMLGTGKLDLRSLKQIAIEQLHLVSFSEPSDGPTN